ncbi:MAG: hypothetical protein CVU79_00020 [Elusimicrobia bacterium HGW-Elusimicrobia-3]|nr:MAG: hypothetical protein CVU79_00020 [Elusimicrobia bacterium HGW-Elusimicrobia-3]
MTSSPQRPHFPEALFGEVFLDATGGNAKIESGDYLPIGKIPVIDQGQEYIAGFTNNESLKCKANLPCILFGDHTKIFKFVNQPFALGADGIKVLVPSAKLNPRYAYYCLQRVWFPPRTGYQRHFKYLQRAKIPMPPLEEQGRIAAILDKADAIRRKRQEAGKIASSFAQSLFLDLIGDPISNPKKWKMVPLEEVATTTSGGTPNRKVDAYYGGDIPWVKSGELSQGVVTTTEETLTECGLLESSAKVMPVGTVLLAMYGATAGLVAKLGIEAATNQAVCCIRPGKHIHAEYLLHLLRRHSVSLLTKRVGGAQPNLSQDIIRNLKIPIPPMDVQIDFVQKVACVSSLQRHQESALKETGSLFGAIQGEFF